MRITLLISIPASVGMCLFSSPICQLLLANKPDTAAAAAPLLATLSLAIAFSSTLFTTNAILQSFGKPTIPVLNMAIGGVVKIAVSYVLIGFPRNQRHGQRHQHRGVLSPHCDPEPHPDPPPHAPHGQHR